MKAQKKIAILYLDEFHQLHHFLGLALELQNLCELSIITFKTNHDYLFNYLNKYGGEKIKVEELPTLAFREFTDKLKNRKQPRKLFWWQKNSKYLLNSFDGIIFTDFFHHHLLKKRKHRTNPKFIKMTHGTPGRAYSFQEDLLDFDMNLLLGKYHKEALEKGNLLGENYAVVGYPKMDAVHPDINKPLFVNNRPTVVYNPHFSTPLSSWHTMGLEILDYFYSQQEYNLIFSPHINLFQKEWGEQASLLEKYRDAGHIHIDLGSEDSVNMTYLFKSDIYLGDVSSQVYEFITKPRPCIFLNPTGVEYNEDPYFRFWHCGEVIENAEQLEVALKNSGQMFREFEPIQKRITEENFYSEEGTTASQRAATAIISYLEKSQ